MNYYEIAKRLMRTSCRSEFTGDRMFALNIDGKTAVLDEVIYSSGENIKRMFDAEKMHNEIIADKQREKEERERKEYERKSSLGLINLCCPICRTNSVNIQRDDFEDWWDKPDYGYYMQCSCGLRSGYHHGEEAARDWWNDMLKRGV